MKAIQNKFGDLFREGDKVDYHSVIGEKITSTGHEIELLGWDVAWITEHRGCVSYDALTHTPVDPVYVVISWSLARPLSGWLAGSPQRKRLTNSVKKTGAVIRRLIGLGKARGDRC